MSQNSIQNYFFFKRLTQLSCVKKIILFGSRARSDHTARSDIDLAIDCSGASTQEWYTILDIIDNADTLLHIDCIRYDTLAPGSEFKKKIDQDAFIIYEKKR